MLLTSVWIIVTPWFNGAGASPYSPMHVQIAGALLFLSTVWALARQRNPLPEYVNAAIGCWLIARPFWGNTVPIQGTQLWIIGTLVMLFAVRSAYLARRPLDPAFPAALLTVPAPFGDPVMARRTVPDRNAKRPPFSEN